MNPQRLPHFGRRIFFCFIWILFFSVTVFIIIIILTIIKNIIIITNTIIHVSFYF